MTFPRPQTLMRSLLSSLLSSTLCACAGLALAWLLQTPPSVPRSRPQSRLAPPKRAPGGGAAADDGVEAAIQRFLRAGSLSGQMAAALRLGENGTSAELRALLENAHRFPANAARGTAEAALLRRWLALDPSGALEFCRRHQEAYLPELAGSLALDDPGAAEDLVRTLPQDGVRAAAWEELARSLLLRGPKEVWDLLSRVPGGEDGKAAGKRFRGLHPVFQKLRPDASWENHLESPWSAALLAKLAAADPVEAFVRLDTLPAALRQKLAPELMRVEPDRAWAWISLQPYPAPLLSGALLATLEDDPATALRLLGSLPPDGQAAVIFNGFSSPYQDLEGNLNPLGMFLRFQTKTWNWKGQDIPSIAQLLSVNSSLTEQSRRVLTAEAFKALVHANPAGASTLVPLLPESSQDLAMKKILERWRARDREGAGDWLAALPEGPLRSLAQAEWQSQDESEIPERFRPTIVDAPDPLLEVWRTGKASETEGRKLAGKSPAKLDAEFPPEMGDVVWPYALSLLAPEDPAAAAAWLRTWPLFQNGKTPPEADAGGGDGGAGAALTEADAGAGAGAAASGTSAAQESFRATFNQVDSFLDSWAETDSRAAAAWVKTLPSGELARRAAFRVALHFQEYAPAEAEAWLNSLPSGPIQEAARKAFLPP